MSERFGARALSRLPQSVHRPGFDPASLKSGIVHLGIGAFHRAHQAVFTQDAIAHHGGDWGIVGASLQRADVPDALKAQDCLYTVESLGTEASYQLMGVVREALVAAFLTAMMILLFLGSWRSTLIVCLSIPLSILTSIIVLGLLGQTINVMTLGGLALAVGILVDDATVEIENVHRNMGIHGKTLVRAILDGAQQIARERRHAAALEPCRLAGAGQPDGQHYKAPRRPRRARRLRWDGGGRFRLCLHNQLTFRNWLAWRISSSCTSIGSGIALMSDIVQISSDNGRFLRRCLYLRVG